jgi:hypothetical protein
MPMVMDAAERAAGEGGEEEIDEAEVSDGSGARAPIQPPALVRSVLLRGLLA